MTSTVINAFNEFMRDIVNLDASQVTTARSSRDWLLDQIQRFPSNDSTSPMLKSRYSGDHIAFGSFARKTKTRPLDDIDLMVCMDAEFSDSLTYCEYSHNNVEIHISNNYHGRYENYRHTTSGNEYKLSSIRIVNKFVNNLSSVPQYKKAETRRNGEAAILNLSSYDWSFDIVPCIKTANDIYGKNYYLIPNGSGHWKKTDPRIDRDRLQRINQACNGNVLQVIRILKYWNQRPYKAGIPSYLLETMISNYYDNEINRGWSSLVSGFIDMELVKVFEYLKNNIFYNVNDPKGIAGNINDIGYTNQNNLYQRLTVDFDKAKLARTYEGESKQKECINKWREVFGDLFPQFT